MPKEPLLNDFELQHEGVQKILHYFEARLIELRIQNDNPKADRLTRGKIAEIKSFNKIISPKKHLT